MNNMLSCLCCLCIYDPFILDDNKRLIYICGHTQYTNKNVCTHTQPEGTQVYHNNNQSKRGCYFGRVCGEVTWEGMEGEKERRN